VHDLVSGVNHLVCGAHHLLSGAHYLLFGAHPLQSGVPHLITKTCMSLFGLRSDGSMSYFLRLLTDWLSRKSS